jgi:protein-tyrosine-phosphatase
MATGPRQAGRDLLDAATSGAGEPSADELMAWLSTVSLERERFAAENRALHEQIRALEARLEERMEISEERLIAELPGRTARVLQSAKEVAEEIIDRATARSRALEEAGRHSADVALAQAEADARSVLAAADAERQRIVASAEAARERMLVDAERERDAILSALSGRRAELENEIADASAALREVLKAHDNLRRSIEEALVGVGFDAGIDGPPTGPVPLEETSWVADEHPPERDGSLRILVVDDEDPFRAVFAAALLDHGVVRAAIRDVLVRAGTAQGKGPGTQVERDVFARHGLRLGHDRPIALSAEAVREADLVLAATSSSVERAIDLHPEAVAFTFRQILRMHQHGGAPPGGASLQAWLQRNRVAPVGAPRRPVPGGGAGPTASGRASPPHARSARYYHDTARDLVACVTAVGRVLWPDRWVVAERGTRRVPEPPRHAFEEASTASPIRPMSSRTPPNRPSQIPNTNPLAATTAPAPITNGQRLAAGK